MKVDTPLDVFKKALDNVGPMLEVKSKRIGGATYQVPMEVSRDRRSALAMRWILLYSRSRKGKTMAQVLDFSSHKKSVNQQVSGKSPLIIHKKAPSDKDIYTTVQKIKKQVTLESSASQKSIKSI